MAWVALSSPNYGSMTEQKRVKTRYFQNNKLVRAGFIGKMKRVFILPILLRYLSQCFLCNLWRAYLHPKPVKEAACLA